MQTAQRVIVEVGREYGRLTGREYGLLEPYRLDDAEVAIVALGSTCGTAKVAADRAREEGIRAGVLKLRSFRPFPGEEIAAGAAARRRGGRVGSFDLLRAAGRAAVPRGPLVRPGRRPAGQLRVRPWRPRTSRPATCKACLPTWPQTRPSGESDGVYRYIGLRESKSASQSTKRR